MQFRKITIIGVGLLGGSIGLAAGDIGVAGEIAGFVRSEKAIADCEKFGATDYATTDLLAAVSNADLVILCTPLAQMRSLAEQFLPALKRGAIVTDVGSVKAGRRARTGIARQKIRRAFCRQPSDGRRGKIRRRRRARGIYFENAVCVLTPTKKSNAAAVRKLERFWKSLGARVLKLDAGAARFARQPLQSFAARRCGDAGQSGFESGESESAVRALRDGFSRHDAHRVRLARNVARHRPGQPQKSFTVAGRFYGRTEKISAAVKASDAKAIEKFFETAK